MRKIEETERLLLTLRLNWIAQPPADAVAAVALH
jgi:hypothetical protein